MGRVSLRRTLCALPSSVGAIRSTDEYAAKVMSDGPTIFAIGRDFARFLPGIFTANFFGDRYCALIGSDRLLSAPPSRVRRVDDGILLALGEDPAEWCSPERAEAEQAVVAHLGRELFFSKAHSSEPTRAPDWTSG